MDAFCKLPGRAVDQLHWHHWHCMALPAQKSRLSFLGFLRAFRACALLRSLAQVRRLSLLKLLTSNDADRAAAHPCDKYPYATDPVETR